MNQAKTSSTDFIVALQSVLYKPCRRCFEEIILGRLCAVGCITSWIQAANNDKRYKKVYHFIARIGMQSDRIQLFLIRWTLACRSLFPLESPITLVVDDAQSSVMVEKLKALGICTIRRIPFAETPFAMVVRSFRLG